MGKLRDRMEQDLKLGGYSPATQRIYLLYAREFARYHMRSGSIAKFGFGRFRR